MQLCAMCRVNRIFYPRHPVSLNRKVRAVPRSATAVRTAHASAVDDAISCNQLSLISLELFFLGIPCLHGDRLL